jgi:putative Mn2+ efflux pump MntP
LVLINLKTVSFLKKYLKDHRIDIVSIQETKMENIKDGFLLALSTSITNWIVKPSLDNSGGILVGINTYLVLFRYEN